MQLLTEQIKQALPDLYTTEDVPTDQKRIGCKFFNPCGPGTWYAVEGSEDADGDWTFFGLVDLLEREWGYFTLSELESLDVGFGLGIERDSMVGPTTYHPEWAAHLEFEQEMEA